MGGTEDTHNILSCIDSKGLGLTAPVQGKEPWNYAHVSPVPEDRVDAAATLDTVLRKERNSNYDPWKRSIKGCLTKLSRYKSAELKIAGGWKNI